MVDFFQVVEFLFLPNFLHRLQLHNVHKSITILMTRSPKALQFIVFYTHKKLLLH